MMESLDLVKAGIILKHDQRLDNGSYESWFGKDQAAIDWAQPAGDVYNIIRAANPTPGAWTVLGENEVQVYDSARADGVGGPGEVVAITPDGVTVQANVGRILVKRVRPKGGDKQAASEWAETVGLKPGTKLG